MKSDSFGLYCIAVVIAIVWLSFSGIDLFDWGDSGGGSGGYSRGGGFGGGGFHK